MGAKHYTGVDGSEQMVDLAHSNLIELNGEIHHKTIESYDYPKETFDLVTSRFVFHYIPDIHRQFQEVYHTLKENGRFVFSIQHPLTTSSFISKQTGDKRENWIVDDYFLNGERKETWINQVVIKYHRTIEQYFTALRDVGFAVLALREGSSKRENFSSEEEYNRRQRIPVVLVFSCVK